MESQASEAAIAQAIAACVSKDGWVNLAEVGTQLRRAGVRYGKLSSFLGQYPGLVELRIDDTVVPPAVYVRMKNESEGGV